MCGGWGGGGDECAVALGSAGGDQAHIAELASADQALQDTIDTLCGAQTTLHERVECLSWFVQGNQALFAASD